MNDEINIRDLSLMRHQEICPEKWKQLIDAKIKRDKNMTSVNLSAATDEFKCYKCKENVRIINYKQDQLMNQ